MNNVCILARAPGGRLVRWPSSTMAQHCLRRAALHLLARRSCQNVKLFLRQPLKSEIADRSCGSRKILVDFMSQVTGPGFFILRHATCDP
jgi:hypothetical protein